MTATRNELSRTDICGCDQATSSRSQQPCCTACPQNSFTVRTKSIWRVCRFYMRSNSIAHRIQSKVQRDSVHNPGEAPAKGVQKVYEVSADPTRYNTEPISRRQKVRELTQISCNTIKPSANYDGVHSSSIQNRKERSRSGYDARVDPMRYLLI